MRPWLRTAALVAAGLAPRLAPLQAQDRIEAVMEVRFDAGPRGVMLVQVVGDRVLVPVREVLDLAGIGVPQFAPRHRLTARSAGIEFTVDTDTREVARDDSTRRLPFGTAYWTDDELYLDADALASGFGASATLSLEDLVITFSGPGVRDVPAVRRAVRDAQRATLLQGPEGPGAARTPVSLQTRLADGAVLDWFVSSATRQPVGAFTGQATLGTAVFGGGLTSQVAVLQANDSTYVHGTGSWLRAWHGPVVRQVALGDVATSGLRSWSVRGATITNQPYIRAPFFGYGTVHGVLPPGWEVELYQGAELVGYAPVGPEGRYALPASLQYGPNALEVVTYGTEGQVVRHDLLFPVSAGRLPRGRFEYAASAGACRNLACDALASADARFGLSDRLTLQAGVDRFWRDTLPDFWHPYVAIAASPHRVVSVAAEGVWPSRVAGSVSLDPSQDLRFATSLTWFDPNASSPILGGRDVKNRVDADAFWRPRALLGERTFLTLRASRANTTFGYQGSWQGGVTFRAAFLRIAATGRHDYTGGGGTITGRTTAEVVASGNLPPFPSVLRGTFVRSALAWDPDFGLVRGELGISRRIAHSLRLELFGRWARGTGAGFDLALTMDMPAFRATSRNGWTAGAGIQGSQTFEGSVILDPYSGQVALENGRAVGRGGVRGTVFLDRNGNGRLDDDESGIPDVLVRVGPRATATDAHGRFSAWDVPPFASAALEIDTLSLPNPQWVPAWTRGGVRPQPNSFGEVLIPVLEGAELTGAVTFPSGAPVTGIAVRVMSADGTTWKEALTFSDGTFYLFGLRPGTYTVVLDQARLDVLGAAFEPMALVVPEREGGASLSVAAVIRPR